MVRERHAEHRRARLRAAAAVGVGAVAGGLLYAALRRSRGNNGRVAIEGL